MRTRFAALLGAVALASLILASAAHADNSQIKISEVYSDGITGASDPKQDYVELQLAAPAQTVAGGDILRLYSAQGNNSISFVFPPGVSNLADSQRTILFGWDTNPAVDFSAPAQIIPQNAGGAWCLVRADQTQVDCVSWGTFAGGPVTTAGTPFPSALNIAGQSLTRKITPNCPTLLDPADDTNNSAVDFGLAGLTPRNNLALPTEAACPPPPAPTEKKKCKKKKGKKRSLAVADAAKKKKCKKKKKKD